MNYNKVCNWGTLRKANGLNVEEYIYMLFQIIKFSVFNLNDIPV